MSLFLQQNSGLSGQYEVSRTIQGIVYSCIHVAPARKLISGCDIGSMLRTGVVSGQPKKVYWTEQVCVLTFLYATAGLSMLQKLLYSVHVPEQSLWA